MVRIVLITSFLTISGHLYSQDQSKNSFGITAGIGQPDELVPFLVGGGNVTGAGFELGVNYYRRIAKKIKFETGIIWHGYRLTVSRDTPPFTPSHAETRLFYLPMMIRLNFSNHFFMNAGLLADFDLRMKPILKNQTGLGMGLGFGYETSVFGKLMVQINPYFNVHSIFVVRDVNHCDCVPSGLLERGIRIGIRTKNRLK